MTLTNLKSDDLKRVVKLLEQKEELQAQIEAINHNLEAFEAGQSAPVPTRPVASEAEAKPPSKRKMSKAGRARISAAAKARWARVREMKAPRPAPTPAKPATAQPRKRGQLKEQIIGLVKRAGKLGVTVKEIAAELGAKPDGIHVWFNATGKRVKEIKRIRPATYAWVR